MFLLVIILGALSSIQGELSRKPRIVGGSYLPIEVAPWHVAIQQSYSPLCGGTILSENYILSSASCVKDLDIKEVTVLSGTSDLFNDDNTLTNITNLMVHPDFNGTDNDLAVIQLSTKLVFGNKQQPATLSGVFPTCTETVSFTGFGATNDGFPTTPRPYNLRSISLSVWPGPLCSYYTKEFNNKYSVICAGIYNGPCFGDEGGSITLNNKVIGVAIKRNCYQEKPALFSNLAFFKEFINTATNGEAVWECT